MGMPDFEDALNAARESDLTHFVGPRDPQAVAAAEDALEISLPPTYRRFVTELGAGGVGPHEFYGVIDDNFEDSGIPDGVWLTLAERKRLGLPKPLVIVGETGMGEFYVLDTDQRDAFGECPVVIWAAGRSQEGDMLEVVAHDFGSFFLDAVEQACGPRG